MEATAIPAPNAPQIFISHARADARHALQVERALTVWGAQPWMDRQQLAGGQEWPQELRQAIDRSAALIVVVTPAALASAMVRREYLHALSLGKPVLLVRFKPAVALPTELAGLPSVDYWGKPLAIGTGFYLMLEERGLLPAPDPARPVALAPGDMFHLYVHRLPPDWQVYQTPLRVSQRRVAAFGAALAFFLVGALLAPTLTQATLGKGYLWVPLLLPPVALIALFAFRSFFQIAVHLNIVLGRLPRDTVILAPDHCTAQIYTFDHRRLAMAPYRYAFKKVARATASHDRQGRAVVTFTYANGAPPERIVLPRTLPDRHAVAARIASAALAFRNSPPVGADATERIAPQNMLIPATANTPVATYCVIAATRDQPLLSEIQAWLARRGIAPEALVVTPGAEGLLLPTQESATRSRFALILPSPAVARSPQCQAISADLRRQGKLVIPIRTDGAATLPDHLAALQWVDFSPGIDHARSFLDLCDTLDQAGALPALPPDHFDAEVALARAIHERVPPDWYAAKPDSSVDRAYRVRQIANVALLIYPLGLSAIFATAAVAPMRQYAATHDAVTAAVVNGATILILLALCAFPWRWGAGLLRSYRLFRRLRGGYHAPQCIVITPTGVAFHVVNARGEGWNDGGVAFAALRRVDARYGAFGVTKLRLTPKQGAPILMPLTYFGAFTDTIIARAQAGMGTHHRC